MAKIEEKYLQQLRDAGLFVSPPFAPTNAWPDGVWVGKPTSVGGNCIPDYRDGSIVIGDDRPLPPDMDAPMVVLCFYEDILSFYFGDPQRMEAKAEARKPRRSPKT
jgi:hypothetical protein